MADRSLANYFKVQMNTAGAGQRVIMIYDGIAKNLRTAIQCFGENTPANIEKINNSIQLAERLILELRLALDMEKGGELSENLRNLYDFWINYLSEANVEKNLEKVEEVLAMVDDLRLTWSKAVKEARKMGIGS